MCACIWVGLLYSEKVWKEISERESVPFESSLCTCFMVVVVVVVSCRCFGELLFLYVFFSSRFLLLCFNKFCSLKLIFLRPYALLQWHPHTHPQTIKHYYQLRVLYLKRTGAKWSWMNRESQKWNNDKSRTAGIRWQKKKKQEKNDLLTCYRNQPFIAYVFVA